MFVEIERVSNGYVLRYEDQDGEEETFARAIVFQEKQEVAAADVGCECEHTIEMLYEILELFGDTGTKHNKHRVEITCKCQGEKND